MGSHASHRESSPMQGLLSKLSLLAVSNICSGELKSALEVSVSWEANNMGDVVVKLVTDSGVVRTFFCNGVAAVNDGIEIKESTALSELVVKGTPA